MRVAYRIAAGVVISVLVATAITVAVLTMHRETPKAFSGKPVRLGLPLQSTAALAMVAVDAGLMSEEGLDVRVHEYPSGKRALQDLLQGKVDVATCADVPIVFASFQHNDFRIIATIGSLTTSIERVVARKDRGIEKPRDLRGKRIATQRGSAVHFFLHVFLAKHGLSEKDVEMVFLKAEDLPQALVSGQVDAFSMREPYVGQAVRRLGDNAVVFADPRVYFRSEHLVASTAFLREHPEQAERIVAAIVRAEELAAGDRDRTIEIVQARLDGDSADPARVGQEIQNLALQVSLSQFLLTSLEDEARWALNFGLVEAAEMPNYLRFIYTDALEAVAPGAVTIIR